MVKPISAVLALLVLANCSAVRKSDECVDAGGLRQAALRLYAGEATAFHKKDVDGFVPCANPDAVYLVTVDHDTHTCRQVREHARERFSRIVTGEFSVRIITAVVDPVQRGHGQIDYEFSFANHVTGADGVAHFVQITGEHKDTWTCDGTMWRLASMTEVKPQAVTVDGKRREN